MKIDINILSSLLACKANQHNFHKFWNTLTQNEKYIFAKSKYTPINIFIILSKEQDYVVREYVARNTSTPANALALLSIDGHPTIRSSVAQNPSTDPDTLTKLSYDENDYWGTIKAGVARNLATPRNILKQLSYSENDFVRQRVAENPSWINYEN